MSTSVLVFMPILVLVLWFGTLAHCLMNQKLRDTEKLTWVLVIIFLNVIGAAIYLFVGRNPRR